MTRNGTIDRERLRAALDDIADTVEWAAKVVATRAKGRFGVAGADAAAPAGDGPE